MNLGKNIDGLINGGGAFLSPQEIVSKCKNGGGGGGEDLPTPTIADAGSVVVVDNEGKYALGEAGVTSTLVTDTSDELDKSYNDIIAMITAGTLPFMIFNGEVLYMSFIDDEAYEVDFAYTNGDTRNYVSSTADGTLVYSGGAV